MYKTIVVHVDGRSQWVPRLRVAAALARQHGGHLVASAVTGMSRREFLMLGTSPMAALPDADYDRLREAATALQQHAAGDWHRSMVPIPDVKFDAAKGQCFAVPPSWLHPAARRRLAPVYESGGSRLAQVPPRRKHSRLSNVMLAISRSASMVKNPWCPVISTLGNVTSRWKISSSMMSPE